MDELSLEFGHEKLRLHGLALSCTASMDPKGESPRHAPRYSGTERVIRALFGSAASAGTGVSG